MDSYHQSMKFRLLGQVAILTNGDAMPLPRHRERCLLAILLTHLNHVVSSDRLTTLLWEGDPPDAALSTLRSHVCRVRAALTRAGAGNDGFSLASVSGGYRLTGSPESVDAHQFRLLVDRAVTLTDVTERISEMRMALGLWHGPPFADIASPQLRDWLRADLEERRLNAIEQLAVDSLAVGHNAPPELTRAVAEHPGHEDLVALLMRALCQRDRRAEALGVYAHTRAYLAEQLGLDPGLALRKLQKAILRDELPSPRLAARPSRRYRTKPAAC